MRERLSLDMLLGEQHDLTAVEKFARVHDADELPPEVRRYRALIPHEAPRRGQQYAFEVDLDACTGCKACVTGCHNLNGLDDGEVWRTVGLLHGGTAQAPAQQTVTTACHHCLEPACMLGCPVRAYEKDPITGIVKHLDDQCIGCQYCIFMCPYDAPKYNARRGIVRKCDMCSDRLAHGEAPACVQSCPNEAIRITVVETAQVVEAAQAGAFVPGAAGPSDTLPSTAYQTRRPMPRNLLPADYYAVNAEHSHPPLVMMLVLTQLSVGTFAVDWLLRAWLGGAVALRTSNALFALALGVAAMAASVFHLGRPLYSFRAFLGLRTSWLSREIIGFSIFSGLAAAYAVSFFLPPVAHLAPLLDLAVTVAGVAAVGCSVMVYAATGRECWRAPSTALKFFATAALLGCATLMLGGTSPALARALCAIAAFKLAYEAAAFRHLRRRQHTALKRAAILMKGDLGAITAARFVCGLVGGVLLPALVGWGGVDGRSVALAIVALTLGGELCERWLFFTAATAPKMPGGPA
jgi:Fe-S-cluster-containing dehydrogenase component/DMSO reductase anchor subunit